MILTGVHADAAEVASLAVTYLPEVTAFVRRMTAHHADADDLVQDVFERAFRSLADLEDVARCRAWLFRIARNRVIDWQRTRLARPELRLLEGTDSVASEPFVAPERVEQAQADAIEAALGALSADLRDAVLLADVWGCSYDEIAEIVQVPIGTVRSRIARARLRLAELLSDQEAKPGAFGKRGARS